MIDVYVLTSPNVQKVLIALEELELPYRMHLVDVWKGDHFLPGFEKLNPNRKIPVIVDQEGPGGKPYTVFESGVILMYLAEKAGRLWPADTARRYEVMQWLMFQMANVGPAFGNFIYFSEKAPPGNDHALSRFLSEAHRLYDILETRLASVPHLGGDEYSIADIAVYPWIRGHKRQGVDLATLPNLNRWFTAIEKRPAVKAMIALVSSIKTNRENASQDQWDRLHGRGRFARQRSYSFRPT